MGATDQHQEKLFLSVLVFLLRGKSLMRIPLLPLPLTKKTACAFADGLAEKRDYSASSTVKVGMTPPS